MAWIAIGYNFLEILYAEELKPLTIENSTHHKLKRNNVSFNATELGGIIIAWRKLL